MPTPRGGLAVAAIDATIYAVYALTLRDSATVEAYDPGSNTWTTRASMPTRRAGLGVTAINGTLYAVGGRTCVSSGFAAVEAYDPASNTTTRTEERRVGQEGRVGGTAASEKHAAR